MDVVERVEPTVASACATADVELFDLEFVRGTLRVTVQRAGGIDLDAVAVVARTISDALDALGEDVIVEAYELEVTTPGLERRLRRREHFLGARGETVSIRTKPGTVGDRRFDAIVVGADDDGVDLLVGTAERRRLAYSEIERAHTVFDWRQALAGSKGRMEDHETIEGRATPS